MIRRFALEYACKSQAHEGLNGLSDTSELLPHQPDPDGPLDLTVSRASQALQGNQVFFFMEIKTVFTSRDQIQEFVALKY